MGRPLLKGGNFEFEKSFKSYAAYEKYLNKTQKTISPSVYTYEHADNSISTVNVDTKRGPHRTQHGSPIRSNLAQIQDVIPEPVQDLISEDFTEQVVQVAIIKKKGRPRKVPSALEFDNLLSPKEKKSNVKRLHNNNNLPIRSWQRIKKTNFFLNNLFMFL